MKRIWVMTVGLLLGSSSSVWAEQTSSTSDYLKNMNQLYEFAWSLQYTQEGPYDIWLVHDEQGITKSQSNFPQSVLGGCGRFLGPELSNSKTASILHWTQTS